MRNSKIAVTCLLALAVTGTFASQSETTQLPPLSGSTETEIASHAEKEGATFNAESRAPSLVPKSFLNQDLAGNVDRKCVAASGVGPVRSGQFVIGGELSGPMPAMALKKVPPKIWWAPLHHASAMTLVVRGKLVGSSGAGARFTSSNVAHPVPRQGMAVPVAEREYFFPSGIEFLLQGGRWIVVATQGPDWGCFVLTMPPPQSPPADFALRFEFGLCTTDVLDTFKGVFIRDLGSREPPLSVPLNLTGESLRVVYEDVVRAKLSDYPETFRVQGNIGFAPAMHFKLETRMGGVSHAVTWSDGIRPSTPEADRLRGLFTRVISLITNHPDVKGLPKAKVGCA